MSKVAQIADSIHGSIQVSILEKKIISTHVFNRLHDVLQNSTAFLTFPANQTKRFSHSLGTMDIAGKMFYYSFINADSETRRLLLSETIKAIHDVMKNEQNSRILRGILGEKSNIIDNQEYLHFNISDPFYRDKLQFDLSQDKCFSFIILYQSIRCAALLHDIGHPPFSHISEYALVDVFNTIKGLESKNARQKYFYDIMLNYYQEEKDKINLHEVIGTKVATRLLEHLEDDLKQDNAEVQEKLFYFLVNQITHKILNSDENDKKENFFGDIHHLISGSVDADRLDYVSRDFINSGFNKGLIELDRLLLSMRILIDRDPQNIRKFRFCFDIRSLNTIEDFFRRRWDLYKYLIYHHRVRKTDSILQKIIVKLCLDYLKDDSDERSTENKCLPMDISGLWKAVVIATGNDEYFNSLIQWNDSWLMSILRYTYFIEYYNKDDEIKLCLEEFLSSKRQYNSLIKRSKDFEGIDLEICREVSDDSEFIEILKKIRDAKQNKNIVIKNTIGNILDLIEKDTGKREVNHKYSEKGFISVNFLKLMIAFSSSSGLINYNKVLEESAITSAENLKIKDHILKINELKTGIKNVFLHEGEKLMLLKNISRIQVELQNDELLYPQFYLFVTGEKTIKDLLYKELARQFTINIKNELKTILKEFA